MTAAAPPPLTPPPPTTSPGRSLRDERLAVLRGADHLLAATQVAIATAEADSSAPDVLARLDAREDAILDQRTRTLEAYLAGIPRVAVSRCPHTDTVLTYPLDLDGLDGPWWDAHAPVRPLVTDLPRTFAALTGSLVLDEADGPLPVTDHLVSPGPARPYVLPELLARDEVTAVVSAVSVAGRLGIVATYFDGAGTSGRHRWPAWGTSRTVDADGWIEVAERAEDRDHDLAPWLASGRLVWIEPGDVDLELRTGTDGCPYLDLDGTTAAQRLQHGRLWTGPG